MRWPLYLRLVTLTTGTLLSFFWMVVILGHRRQRNFERIFFFLCLALTSFFGGSLLAVNAQLFYGAPPAGLMRVAWVIVCTGLWFIPPLTLLLHVEYAGLRGLIGSPRTKRIWVVAIWLPAVPIVVNSGRALGIAGDFDSPTRALGLGFQLYLVLSLAMSAYWQQRFLKVAPDQQQFGFHRVIEVLLILISFLSVDVAISQKFGAPTAAHEASMTALVLAVLPLGILIANVQRFNFLQIGRQRNLLYAVFGVFLALLYLSFVRRVTFWLEPHFPPEASAALLLFLPVVFFEPLQRLIRRLLQSTAQKELDSVRPLAMKIHAEASKGDLRRLVHYIEDEVKNRFQFESVRLAIGEANSGSEAGTRGDQRHGDESFSVYRPGRLNGVIAVRPHGAMISGEAAGAMKFLSESIAGAVDMCMALERKLELERELAERERMALVGQMAASISHNLKNPLGSIKTILQVQMENSELPPSVRGETQIVLDEINRLSAKLNQLLQFSRTGVRPSTQGELCDIAAVAANVAEVLAREAESRGISVELARHPNACAVVCPAEAANDILSNVVLNAIEAVGHMGRVAIGFSCESLTCTITVEDDGPGITPELREKIMHPFFTTKPRGTGLGLAIVARRLEEIGGKLEIDSPVAGDRGSRFRLAFPLAPKEVVT